MTTLHLFQFALMGLVSSAQTDPNLIYDFDQGFTRYSVADGLSESSVRDIAQDHLGFLWIATKFGLNRYDGNKFDNFTTRSTNFRLPDNHINDLLFDSHNERLWLGTSSGLAYFDLKSGIADSLRFVKVNDNGSYWRLTLHGPDNILALRYDGNRHHILDIESSSLNETPVVTSERLIETILLVEEYPNILWYCTSSQVIAKDLITEEVIFRSDKLEGSRVVSGGRRIMWDDLRKKIVVSSGNQDPFTIDPASMKQQELVQPPIFNGVFFTTLVGLDSGRYLFGSANNGFYEVSLPSGNYKNYKREKSNTRSLSNDKVYALFKDKDGGIWIGTDYGLSYYDPRAFLFRNVEIQLKPYRATPIIQSAHFTPDRSGIIASGSFAAGGVKYDLASGTQQYFNFLNEKGSANANYSYNYRSKNGELYLMNTKHIVRQVSDTIFEKVLSLEEDLEDYNGQVLQTFCIDELGRLIALTYSNEIFVFDDRHLVDRYENIHPSGAFLPGGNSIYYEDQKAWLLFSSDFGYFDFELKKWVSKKEGISQLNGLTKPSLDSFKISPDGTFFMIANDNDIISYDAKTDQFSRVFPEVFSPYVLYDCQKDSRGVAYAYTNKGLLRCHPNGNSRMYTVLDGLPYHMNIHVEMHRDQNGYIIFTSDYNVSWFHEDSLNMTVPDQAIHLSGFNTKGKQITTGTSYDSHKFDLNASQNSFDFEVTSPYYSGAGATNFLYRLEGHDDTWRNMGDGRRASYTLLPGGDYSLQVKGYNSFGEKIPNQLNIPVSVATPFYRSLWFILLSIALIGLLIFMAFRVRLNQIRSSAELEAGFEKKLAEVEMSALRAQMNPHFLFNCLNSIKFFIIKNEPEQAADYLTKFSRLIRLILNNSKSELVNLSDELEALGLYVEMEKLRFEKAFNWIMKVDPQLRDSFFEIPPLLLQPYVENAIWHGLLHKDTPGHLEVNIQKENEMLIVTIKDNGIGRKMAAKLKSKSSTKRKSLGMQITKDRITAINSIYKTEASVEIIDNYCPQGVASGTTVTVTIPI